MVRSSPVVINITDRDDDVSIAPMVGVWDEVGKEERGMEGVGAMEGKPEWPSDGKNEVTRELGSEESVSDGYEVSMVGA